MKPVVINFLRLLLFAFSLAALAGEPELKPVPCLKLANGPDYWAPAFADIYRLLALNLKPPEPPFKTRYAVPAPKFKKEVYLWDTAFIALVWQWRDADVAQEIFLPLFEIAGPDGMIPHSSLQTNDSQPPVLSWSVWRIFQATGDRSYLEKVYPALKNYNLWLYQKRTMPNGLFFWDNRFESGLDNSPRFTNRSATRIRDLSRLAAVDLCSYMVMDDLALAQMAEVLGRKDDAAEFRKKAQALKELVNRYLWDEKDGLYYDFDFKKNRLVKINNNCSFLPLAAGIPGQDQAQKLLRHIMDPAEYNSLIPLPTIALNHPNFFLDMWMGPVWLNIDYLIILGMKDYGFNAQASELTWKLADGLYQIWSRDRTFYEFYDPQSLEINNLHRKTGTWGTLSGREDTPVRDFVGWTGLVNNLVIEVLFGLSKKGESWTLRPCFPPQSSGRIFSLSLPADNLEVSLELKSPDQIKALVLQSGKSMSFELGAGRSASWASRQ